MIILATILGLMLILVLRVWPQSNLSTALHSLLVQVPAQGLSHLRRVHLIMFLLSLLLLPVAGRIIFMIGSADMAIMYVTHAAIYSDLLLAGLAVAASVRFRSVTASVRTMKVWGLIAARKR